MLPDEKSNMEQGFSNQEKRLPQKFWILSDTMVQAGEVRDSSRPNVISLQLPWETIRFSLSSCQEAADWNTALLKAIEFRVR